MSGAQTSTAPNVLFDPLMAGRQQQQTNALAGQQLDLSNANQAQVAQASAGLLSAYPDEASRAAAYPRVVGMLQSQGFAKNAPAQYPGEGTLRAIVNASIPAKDLYSSGALLTPAQQAALGQGNTGTATSTPTTGAAGGTTGTTGTAAPGPAPFVGANLPQGVSPDEDQLVRTVYGEARGEPVAGQQAVASVIKTRMGLGKQGVQDVVFAPNQFEAWSDPKNRPGIEALSPTDPQYQAILNNVVRPVMSGQAQDPTGGATNFYNPALQAQLGRSTPGFAQGNQTTIGNHTFFYGGYAPRGAATATAQPAAVPAGGGGTAGRTQVASTAPVALPAATTEPQSAAPAPDTPWDLPGAPAPDLPPPSTPTATPAPPGTSPAQPQQATGPAAQPAPGGAPAAAPASTSRLPEVSTIPTGRNSPAWQQAQQLIDQGNRLMIVSGSNAGMRAQAQAMIQRGTQQQQLDNMVPAQQDGRPGNLNTTTGQFTPYAPLPSPRGMPGTEGAWDGTKWVPVTPENQANAVQGTWTVTGNGTQQFLPAATTPAEGGYKNMETAYKRDSEAVGGISQEGRTAQADQVRVQEMRNILKTTNTGSGAETQAAIQAFLQSWAPSALTNWTTNYANLDGPAAIQMFQKLGFMGATSQEQQVTPRGGYMATQMFQKFNPGAHLLTATNNGLLAQRLISNQASIDYSQGAQDQFAQQEQNFTSSKPSYSSLAQFDRQWQAQRQPQVYAAAIGALGQQDYSQWSKNLSDAEIQRTLDVVHRADPSAVVNGKGGRLDLSQQGAVGAQPSAPAVGTVQQGYRFNGGDPSNQANWARVQ